MQKIFVSHISEEAALASALKHQLSTEFPGALDIFVSSDRKSILAGAEWLQELKSALREAPIVLVMCSRESVDKPWVNFEAGGGWLHGAPLVPVCHSGMTPQDLPVPLKMLNGIEGKDSAGLQKLHDLVAGVLGVEEREFDRSQFIARFEQLEAEYLNKCDEAGRIDKPLVLCAASEQYSQPAFGFEKDVETLQHYFGDRVDVVRNLTSRRLYDLLRAKQYHIVHLVMEVDKDTGDLVFDPERDRLSPRSFADQLQRSGGIQLVFLATCWSLFLGVDVARVTNMIATHVDIHADHVVRWADYLYDSLRRGDPLFEAVDRTLQQVPDIPLRLIPHHDFSLLPGAPR